MLDKKQLKLLKRYKSYYMMHITIHRLFLYILFVLLLSYFLYNTVEVNSTIREALSSQIARKTHLEVISNNVANANTVVFLNKMLLYLSM